MHLNEILERERRGDDDLYTIHLVQEGSFYRAYEWSAWLCHCNFSNLRATRRLQKNSEESFVFVGFPVTSLEKFTPPGAVLSTPAEKCVDLLLPTETFSADRTVEEMHTDFEHWKSCVQLTESSKKRLVAARSGAMVEECQRPLHMTEIMQRILAYPLEQNSPLDCMMFLADVKRQIAALM